MSDSFRGNDWEEKRILCYVRDNHKCRICGDTKKLAAHHIIPYHKTKNNDLKNLITLCPTCHTKTENKFRQFGSTNHLRRLIEENAKLQKQKV